MTIFHFKPSRLWLLPLLAFLCIGWASGWEELKAMAGKVTSVQAEFTQEKHLPILRKPLVSKGTFSFQEPDSLRWEYLQPVQSILLMHKGKIQRYVKGESGFEPENSAGLEAMQVVLDQITQWMKGRFDESPMFHAELDGNQHTITLTPKSDAFKAVIQRIEIHLADQPGVIKEVAIFESKSAFTRMVFTHTVLNEKIDETRFRSVP